jgi:hypothetical protein
MSPGTARIIGYVTSTVGFLLLLALTTNSGAKTTVIGVTVPVWTVGIALYVLGILAGWGLTVGKRRKGS